MELQNKVSMKTIYEIWGRVEDGVGNTVSTPEQCLIMKRSGLIEKDNVPLYSVRTETWEEAMQIHHDHNGWGKYEPISLASLK